MRHIHKNYTKKTNNRNQNTNKHVNMALYYASVKESELLFVLEKVIMTFCRPTY